MQFITTSTPCSPSSASPQKTELESQCRCRVRWSLGDCQYQGSQQFIVNQLVTTVIKLMQCLPISLLLPD